jgi:hypothetical protein
LQHTWTAKYIVRRPKERIVHYTSTASFLGRPLVIVRFAEPGVARSVASGWIAVGDVSFGYLLAAGGVAVGGVSIGGVSFGLLPIGGLAVGLLALGGGAFGVWAAGGLAVAFHAALGGLAVAVSYAQRGTAYAAHANDPEASRFFAAQPFSALSAILSYSRWLLVLVLLPLLPAFLKRRRA